MNTQEAMYNAILENRRDDTPRLIYADYLDETSDSVYAQFIRESVEFARLPKVPLVKLQRAEMLDMGVIRGSVPIKRIPVLGQKVEWCVKGNMPDVQGLLLRKSDGAFRGVGYVANYLQSSPYARTARLVVQMALSNDDDWRRVHLRKSLPKLFHACYAKLRAQMPNLNYTPYLTTTVKRGVGRHLVVRRGFPDTLWVRFGTNSQSQYAYITKLPITRIKYMHVAQDFKLVPMPQVNYAIRWTTRDNRHLYTCDMDTNHLRNALNMLRRGQLGRRNRYIQFFEHELEYRGELVQTGATS